MATARAAVAPSTAKVAASHRGATSCRRRRCRSTTTANPPYTTALRYGNTGATTLNRPPCPPVVSAGPLWASMTRRDYRGWLIGEWGEVWGSFRLEGGHALGEIGSGDH